MSDTPRTNARVKQMIDNDQGPEGLEYWARDLERELNAANAKIQRLEDAGDALKTAGYFGGWGDAVNKWVKVREGKP